MSKKSKKKGKKKGGSKQTRGEAAIAFLGGVLAHALTKLVDDAVDVVADRITSFQERSHKGLKKAKKHHRERERDRELPVANGRAVAS